MKALMTLTRAVSVVWSGKVKLEWVEKGIGKREFKMLATKAAAAAKSLQSCPTLCNPRDGSPPGSPVPGILQARTLEWVAISFSNAWKWKVKVKSLSDVRLLATPWTSAHQAPPSMRFSRQEYWSGVPFPSPNKSLFLHKFYMVVLMSYLLIINQNWKQPICLSNSKWINSVVYMLSKTWNTQE